MGRVKKVFSKGRVKRAVQRSRGLSLIWNRVDLKLSSKDVRVL